MPFIGKQPKVGAYQLIDSITTSATATYALTVDGSAYFPETARNLIVSLNGVTQAPDSAYTVSGSNIVFDSALTASDVIDYILVIGDAVDIGVPSDGTVGNAQLASNIDLSGKTLTLSDNQISGDAIDGGTISNFASTGIDDNATSTALTVTDSGIAATLTTAAQPNVTSVGTLSALSVAGDLTVDTNALKVDTVNNRVGVGTQSPTALLDVAASLNPTIRLKAGLVGNDPSFDDQYMGGVEWFTNDTSGIGAHVGASIRAFSEATGTSTTPSYALTFSTSLANTVESEAMRITRQGNVGIGKTPVARLDVANGTTYTASGDFLARIQQNTNGIGKNGLSVMNAWAATNSTIFECAMGWDGASTGYYPVFKIDGTGQAIFSPQRSEAMRIDTNGNLLVGKTASSFSVAGIELRPDSLTATRSNATTAYFNRTSSTGTVEIIQFNVNTAAAGGINTSQGGTPAFASASDERLKENITEHESELSNVMSLRPVRWNWKDKNRGKGEGFVAQELEQTSWADLVSEGDDGYKRVSGLGVVETRLIKAIQEQQAMIEALQAQVAELQGAN